MRILLCEDEKRLSDALVVLLKHHNLSVEPVYDGQEALDVLVGNYYDAIVLDIMMPKVDGLTVLKTLRERGNNIPIIMLTAKSQTDDIVLGLEMGANDYLIKPFESKELVARIRAITRSALTGGQTSVMKFGNLELNQSNFQLSTEQESIMLSNKEFQLMELFMLNANQIFSTEKLMDKVWGYDSNSEINVVWVHIGSLRKKIDKIGGKVKIHAIRNSGYSLKEI